MLLVTWEVQSTLDLQNQKKPKETQVKNKKQPIQSLIYTVGFLFPITVAYLVHLLKIFISSLKKMWSFSWLQTVLITSISNTALKTPISSKLYQEPHQSTSDILFQCFFPAATFAYHLIKKSSHIAGGLPQTQLLLKKVHWKHLVGIKMIQHNLSEKHKSEFKGHAKIPGNAMGFQCFCKSYKFKSPT